MTADETVPDAPVAEEVAGRLFSAALGALTTMSVYVGDRLGLYRRLRQGPVTPPELAQACAIDVRYAREWLEMQAADGLLTVDGVDVPADERRFTMPTAVAEVMLDQRSLNFLGALPRMIAASAMQLPALLDAYRRGGGVGWDTFGDDARESQEALNRPWLEHALPDAVAGDAELHALLGRPGARMADIGSGGGWSSIGLARAYPQLTVTGYDVDDPSVAMARGNAAGAGVDQRVSFVAGDADRMVAHGPFDLVLACECVHDMPRPVDVLRAARASLAPGGVVVVMDEAVADTFTAPADEMDRLMYGYSLFICLPDGMSSTPTAATGTVMRRPVLEGYAREAGFTEIDVLPIEGFNTWRFYRLR